MYFIISGKNDESMLSVKPQIISLHAWAGDATCEIEVGELRGTGEEELCTDEEDHRR